MVSMKHRILEHSRSQLVRGCYLTWELEDIRAAGVEASSKLLHSTIYYLRLARKLELT